MRRLVLVLAVVLPFLGIAAPAAAAPTITTFTINGQSADPVTVAPGDDVTVAWDLADVTGPASVTITGADGLVPAGPHAGASGQQSGTVTDPVGTTYTIGIDATDDTGTTPSATIEVVVAAAAGATPPPVVVADCVVTVPASDDFTYEAVYDGDPTDTEVLDAGEYTTGELTFEGIVDVEIVAVPEPGVVVDPAAVTSFDVVYDEDCALLTDEFFTVETGCSLFTVTSTADETLAVFWIDVDAILDGGEELGGEFELAPGASRTVQTTANEAAVAAVPAAQVDDEDALFQLEFLEIEQDCRDDVDDEAGAVDFPLPINAPDGGLTASSAVPATPLGLRAVAAAAGVVVLRRLARD